MLPYVIWFNESTYFMAMEVGQYRMDIQIYEDHTDYNIYSVYYLVFSSYNSKLNMQPWFHPTCCIYIYIYIYAKFTIEVIENWQM